MSSVEKLPKFINSNRHLARILEFQLGSVPNAWISIENLLEWMNFDRNLFEIHEFWPEFIYSPGINLDSSGFFVISNVKFWKLKSR